MSEQQSIRDELATFIEGEMENWRWDSVAPEMSQLDYVAGSILTSPVIRRIQAEADERAQKANLSIVDLIRSSNERADERDAAVSTIDRIDVALRGDARSAMLVVTAQEIINDYRDKADG